MKIFLNGLGCLVVLAAAAVIGQAYGLFHAPGLGSAAGYGASVAAWVKGDSQGSPTVEPTPAAPSPESAAAAAQAKEELARLISESKKRAIAKYPDLAVANTEMNSRFVFRYNYLIKESSARLQEANWPETLADECAAAARVRAHPKDSRAPAAVSKKLVADAAR